MILKHYKHYYNYSNLVGVEENDANNSLRFDFTNGSNLSVTYNDAAAMAAVLADIKNNHMGNNTVSIS